MNFSRWLKNRKSRPFSRRGATVARQLDYRPRFDCLEDRLAPAGTFVWNGALNAGAKDWSTASNWTLTAGSDDNANGIPDEAGDIANLQVNWTGAATINFNAAITVGEILLGDTGTGTDVAVTIANGTGGSLTLDNSGAGAAIASIGATNIISATTNLADDLTVTTTNALTYSGLISGAASLTKLGASTLSLTNSANTFGGAGHAVNINAGTLSVATSNNRLGNAANIITFDGGALQVTASFATTRAMILNAGGGTFNINSGQTLTANGEISGTGNLTQAVAVGTLILGSANTYTGDTIIQAGTLAVTNSNALGDSTTTVLLGNTSGTLAATLQINTAGVMVDRDIQVRAGSTGAKTLGSVNTTGVATFSGDIQLDANANLTATTGTVQFTGVFDDGAGSFGLTKVGTGTVILDNTNTYDGVTTVSAGTLSVTGTNQSLGTNNATVANVVNAILRIESAANLGAGATVTVTGPNGILSLVSTSITDPASLLNAASTGILAIDVAGYNTALDLSTLGDGTMSLGSTLGGSYAAASLGVGSGSLYRLGGGNGALTIDNGVLTGGNDVTVGRAGYTTGTVVLASANTYSGTTTLVAGTLALGDDGAISSGTLFLAGGTVSSADATARSLANDLSLDGNIIFGTGTGGTGALVFNGAVALTGTRTLTVNNPAANLVSFDGVIDDGAGTFGITKAGTGTLALNAANTYSGATIINAGTLAVASFGSSITAGGLGQNDNAISMGTGTTAAGLLYTGLGETTNRDIVLPGGTAALTITNNGGALTLAGDITATLAGTKTVTLNGTGDIDITGVLSQTAGVIALTKAGASALTLSGSNLHSGTTILSAGTLVIGHNSALGTGTLSVTGAAAVESDNDARTIANNITLTNTLTVSGPNSLTFGGTVTNSGGNRTLINNLASGKVLTITGNVNLSNDGTARTLTINGSGDTVVSGIVGGPGTSGLTKAGAGTMTLSGTNTYAGTTTLSAGTLVVGNNSALGTGILNHNGGTLQSNDDTRTLANTVTLATNSAIAGPNSLRLTGAFTNIAAGNPTLTNNLDAGKTLTLSGTVSLSNSTTSRTVIFSGTGDTVIDGTIQNSTSTATASALTKGGAGTMTLSGTNTYAGTTTVSGGVLRIANGDAILGAVTVGAPGTFDINNSVETIGALTVNGAVINTGGTAGSALTITTLTMNSAAGTAGSIDTGLGALLLGGAVTITTAGTTATIAGNVDLRATRTFTATGDLLVSATIRDGGVGPFGITNAGTGLMTLTSTNTYTGTTNLTAGTLVVGNDSALGTGILNLNAGTLQSNDDARSLSNDVTLANSSTIAGPNSLTLTGDFTQTSTTSRTLTNNLDVGKTLTLSGTVSLSNGGNRTVTFAGTGDTVIDGDIQNSTGTATASALTKAGAGTMTLSGTNTYGGTTTVAGGILRIANGNAIAGALTVNSAGTFDLNNSVETVGALSVNGSVINTGGTAGSALTITTLAMNSAAGTAGSIDTGAGALLLGNTVTITTAGTTATIAGNVDLRATRTFAATGDLLVSATIQDGGAGPFGITKTGAGLLTLTALNTYSGATSINGGTVSVMSIGDTGVAGNVGTNSAINLNNGTLLYTGAGETNNRVINLSGTTAGGVIDASGTGALIFTSNFTATGAGDKTLTLTGSGVGEIRGNIVNNSGSNTTAVTKNGAGTWIFSTAAKTYTGATTVNAGILLVNSSTAAGSAFTVNGGTLGGTGDINGSVAVNAGGTLAPGDGVMTPGTLTVGNGAAGLTLAAGATYQVFIDSSASFGQVVVTGSLTLADALLSISVDSGLTSPGGFNFVILDNDGTDTVTPGFVGFLDGDFFTVNGFTFQIVYNTGVNANDVALRINSAPVLNTGVSTNLNAIAEDEPDVSNTGTTVDALVATPGLYTDADGVPPAGIAITDRDNANGVWQYSIDGGSSWVALGAVAPNAALLLSADGGGLNRLRFVPSLHFHGDASIDFRGWDRTSGGNDTIADTTTNDGFTAFSAAIETAVLTVSPRNDQPTLTGLDATPAHVIGTAAVILDNNATIADIDLDAYNGGAGNYQGASLTLVRNGGANPADDFGFDTSGALFTVSGGNLQVGGLTFATFTSGAGTLTINFTSADTPATTALVNDVLRRITYRNLGNTSTSVEIDYTFNDGSPGNGQGPPGGPATATGAITVTLTQEVDLTVSGSGSATVVAGASGSPGNLVHTFTVTNNGPSIADGVTFAATATLPANVTILSEIATQGSVASGVWTIGQLGVGASATLTVTYFVNSAAAAGDDIIYTVNNAFSTDPLINTGDDADAVTTTISRQVDLVVAASGPATVVAGSGVNNLIHTFTVTNAGPSDASGVSFAANETLPAGVTLVSEFADIGGAVVGGVWTIGNLAAGATATLTVTYTVDATAASGAVVSYTVNSAALNEPLINTGNDAATQNTTVNRQVDLVVASSGPATVVAGSGANNLVQTFTVTNVGPSNATGVTFAANETLPTGVTLVSEIADIGGPVVGGVWTIGDLAAGATATLTVTYTVSAAAAEGAVVSYTVNTAAANEALINIGNDAANHNTTVNRQVDLVVGSSGPATVIAGSGVGNLIHTFTVTNAGPSNASGVSFAANETLPAGIILVSEIADIGGPVVGGVWTIGDLAAGVTATLTVTYTVSSAAAEGAVVTYTVNAASSNEPRINTGNDAATHNTTVNRQVDLVVASAGPATVVAGSGVGNLVHTFTVTNAGPSNASGVSFAANETLPAGVTLVSESADIGGPVVGGVWTIGNLAAGATATLTVTYTVSSAAVDGATITYTVDTGVANEPLINTGDDAATRNTTVDRQIDLTVSAVGPATVVAGQGGGGNLVYVFTVTNNGPSDASGLTFNGAETQPASVTLDSEVGSAGTGFTAGVWTIGNLVSGGSATLTVTFTVAASAVDGEVISYTLDGAAVAAGENLFNTGDDAATLNTTVDRVSDLQVAKTDGLAFVIPGSTVTYTIVVTNAGPSDVTGAVIADNIPAALTGVTINSVTTGIVTGNTNGGAGNALNDIVSMSAGATITYTISGTVTVGTIGTLTNTVTITEPAGTSDPNTANNTATDNTELNTAPMVDDQNFNVDENSPNGTSVGTVAASDIDVGQILNYAIIGGSGLGIFAIDSLTGEITVSNSAALDFETMPTFTLTVQVTDNSGLPLSDTATITIDLNNVNEPPVITVPGPQVTVVNTVLTITGISVADQDVFAGQMEVTLSALNGFLTLTTIPPGVAFIAGDGTADATMTFTGTLADINAALASISYAGALDFTGPDTIAVTVDDLGNTGSGPANQVTETISVTVGSTNGVFVAPDPNRPGTQALFIYGTNKADVIKVSPAGGKAFKVTINGKNRGTFGPITGRILIFGRNGNDRITVASSVTTDVFVNGGKGNDIIKSGRGDDVLLGGKGNDILTGGDGRDLLIGGVGSDRLVGYVGTSGGATNDDDILIAGRTSFDNNLNDLAAVMAEWTAPDPFAVRVANLEDMLNSLTVFKDTVDNQIAPGPGNNWLFTMKKPNGAWR